MARQRSARGRSRSTRRWWAVTAIAVSLSIGAGVIIANGHDASQTQTVRSSASIREPGGWGRGGYIMMTASGQSSALNGAAGPLSRQARQRLSARRETRQQFLASYKRVHSQEYAYWLSHRRQLSQAYQNMLGRWRRTHHMAPSTTTTPAAAATTTPTASATAATTTTTPTAAATTTPTTTPTATATAAPTAPATVVAGVTQATSPNWAGYAMTGAAGTFTSVAANWIVPPVACSTGTTASSYAVGLDGDGTNTVEQIGTEGDCNNTFQEYSGWFQVLPNAPVFFNNPVKPGDAMTASVTALGAGNFMLTLFDMTQDWTQITEQTSATATLGSAEIVAEDPILNGQAQVLSNFGIVNFLGAAINNAAITAPINEITMVSAAGNTLAVPSTITGGVGNFSVGWDAGA